MFEQRGTFGGLDTCNHTEFGRFDSYSYLRHQIEDRCIHNRHDINMHLDTLVKAKVISSETAENMRESANDLPNERRYKRLSKGATFVPIRAAVGFQEEMNENSIVITYDNRNNNTEVNPGVRVKITRYWPLYLYPCQNSTEYGVQPVVIPSFRGDNKNTMIWIIAAIACQVEPVWMCFAKSIKKSNQWLGFFKLS